MKDLNLLKVFEAIMSTGSVNAAANKLSISAPAVSQSLAKLRVEYNDPLFIRDGRGLKPSSLAKSLYEELEESLAIIMNSSDINSTFEPESSSRTFRIASNSDLDILFYNKLKCKLKEIAPNIKLEMQTEERDEEKIQNLLRLRKVDMILATIPLSEKSYVNEVFFKLNPCIICSDTHPRIGDTISKEEFFNENHYSWASVRNKFRGTLLKQVMKENINDKRNVIYSSQSFFNIAYMASISEDIAISTEQHYEIIKNVGGIKKLKLPFDMNDASVFCSWHRSFSKDKGLIWFKEIIKDILTDLNKKNAT